MMQTIFAPAIALLNRLAYTRKFTLLWMLSMAAIAVVVYSLFVNLERVIQPSLRQLGGIALIRPVSQTVQAIQLHRGLSAALLNGNETMRERRAAQERNVAAAFGAMEKSLPPGVVADKNFRFIRSAWEQLRDHGLGMAAVENLTAHNRLIERLQLFEMFIADDFLLTLDPELATNYLFDVATIEMPRTIENLGQIRAYGTSILIRGRIAEHEKTSLKVMLAELDSALASLHYHLDKAAANNPASRESIRTIADSIDHSARAITDLATLDILTGRLSALPDAFLELATVEIDRSYAQLYDSLLPAAETLVRQRIARAERTLYTNGGIALLISLLVVYLSVSIYYAIVGSIHSLACSARAFAAGDLSARIRLDTRDELSWVAESFNEMADGFNAMLEARKQAEGSLARESRKNEILLRAASDGIHILDLDGNVVQVNDAFARMLGYEPMDLLGMNAAQWDAQWTAAQIKGNIERLESDTVMLETRHRRRDGSLIDVEISVVKVDIDGLPLVYCSSRDVTERKRTERELTENREKLHTIIDTALDAVVQMNAEGVITGWNCQAERIFGWKREEAVGRMLSETIIPPQYRKAHLQGLERFLASGEGAFLNSRVELLGLHRDGREFPVELSITAINTAGKVEFNGFIRDITQQKESEELIWNQANFDALTGLPNRHMFQDRLAQDIKKAHRAGLKTALLFIDLDKFKEINDTLGHSMGDILLKEAGRRISGCVRETDTVARLGGDEFTVILAELDDTGSVERAAENILQTLAKPFRLGDEIAYVSASIGITLHPVDASEAEDLLKNADQAMYAAKNAGRNRFSYFTPSMQQAAQARLRLSNELRDALAAGQFRLHYQPIVELATGRITKAEALIRWQHPERGMVNPAEFIPLAEETGLIAEIGNWVFTETARNLKRWREAHSPMLQVSVNVSPMHDAGFQVSVNVSPAQLRQAGNLCKTWLEYLHDLGLPGESVSIEITEGVLLESESDVTGKLSDFRNAGIQISVDDFGTGYSSLSYLKKFDIDYLKIDQSFVRDLVADPDDLALSEAIIVMAHKLGIKVIAEGVETEAQRAMLAAAGCDYAQGYLFSRPVPAEEFEKLLERRPPENSPCQT